MVRISLLVTVFVIMQSKIESRTVRSEIKLDRVIKSNSDREEVIKCDELPQPVLNEILGAAFNSRYMSVDEPTLEEEVERKSAAGKRGAQDFKPFYVDDTYAMEISDVPAWELSHLKNSTDEKGDKEQVPSVDGARNQRSNFRRKNEEPQMKRPWECEAKIKWLDLGYDYFPRYLRTVECTRNSCFYGHFTCKPRSFTVKILRRRRGECVQTKNRIGIDGLHSDLKELWVWEERAVNFCCDCAVK